jgi:hypothetical protein
VLALFALWILIGITGNAGLSEWQQESRITPERHARSTFPEMGTLDVPPETFMGRRPLRVERVFFVGPGQTQPDRSNGSRQVTFEDGGTLRLRGGGDGGSVVAETTAWVDPFAESVSSENREFIDRCGKWDIFDVSTEAQFAGFLGDVNRR